MPEEPRLTLRKRDGGESPADAVVERVTINDRESVAIVLPESTAEALGLAPGDRFVLEGLEPASRPVEFKYALDAVARHLGQTRQSFVAEHPMELLNTREGEREYWRARTGTPALPTATCRHGLVVRAGGTSFVYLSPDFWETGKDVLTASVHMVLHVLRPAAAEADVLQEQSTVVARASVER